MDTFQFFRYAGKKVSILNVAILLPLSLLLHPSLLCQLMCSEAGGLIALCSTGCALWLTRVSPNEWHMLVEMESHYMINQSQYRVEGLNVHFAFYPSSWSYLTHNHLNLISAILWNLRYCNYTNYSKHTFTIHTICVNITWLT